MSENPLRCPKCNLCNLMKTPLGNWKCPSCGHEQKLRTDDVYKKPKLSVKELEIKKRKLKIQKIEEQILNGDLSLVKKLLPYLNDDDVTISRSVQKFFISNKTHTKKQLLHLLNTADRIQLPKIIENLGRIQTREVTTILLKKINDSDDELKIVIIRALGKTHSEESVIPLVELIPSQDKKIKKEIIFALGEIGNSQALNSLIELAYNSDKELKIFLVDALGKIGEKCAIMSIMNILENYSDESIFQASARALKKIKGNKSIEELNIYLHPSKRAELKSIIEKAELFSDSARVQSKHN